MDNDEVIGFTRLEVGVSTYSGIVFLHIVGALGLFGSIGLEQVGLARLRNADSNAQVREWLALLRGLRRVDAPSGVVILATGFYMAATRWGHQSWIGVALLGMVLMAFVGIAGTGRRARAIAGSVPATDGPVSAALRQRLADPVLRIAASFRTAIGLGIVFLMSVKPPTAGAWAAMGVALVGGAAAAAFPRRPSRFRPHEVGGRAAGRAAVTRGAAAASFPEGGTRYVRAGEEGR